MLVRWFAGLRILGVAVRELDHDAITGSVHRIAVRHAVEDSDSRVADGIGLTEAQIRDAKYRRNIVRSLRRYAISIKW